MKYNLYGTQWNDRTSNEDGYFNAVAFCGDKIIASYLGGKRFSEGQGEPKINYPKNNSKRLIKFQPQPGRIIVLSLTPIVIFGPENGGNI